MQRFHLVKIAIEYLYHAVVHIMTGLAYSPLPNMYVHMHGIHYTLYTTNMVAH